MKIERARISDVNEIHTMIERMSSVHKNLLLPRSLNNIYDNIFNFFVTVESGKVCGCVSIQPMWIGLGESVYCEVRSLIVKEKYKGKGYGKALINRCLREARCIGADSVFALSYIPTFFQSLGFVTVNKDSLPTKVFTDCLNCVSYHKCKEVALIKKLEYK